MQKYMLSLINKCCESIVICKFIAIALVNANILKLNAKCDRSQTFFALVNVLTHMN